MMAHAALAGVAMTGVITAEAQLLQSLTTATCTHVHVHMYTCTHVQLYMYMYLVEYSQRCAIHCLQSACCISNGFSLTIPLQGRNISNTRVQ